MAGALRLATYNLRGLRDDAGAAARVVRAIAPDVLCLQEIPRRLLYGHRVADFAAACGLYWSGGSGGSGGTTIMTGLRVEAPRVGHEGLPVRRFDQQRGFAWEQVHLPGGPTVCAVSVHLGLRAQERVRHVAAILDRVPREVPVVLAGDINEEPTGNAWRALQSRLPLVSPEGLTFPSRGPRKRIDAIFAGHPVRAVDPSAGVPTHLDPGDLEAATDHLPVWADLDLCAVGEASTG